MDIIEQVYELAYGEGAVNNKKISRRKVVNKLKSLITKCKGNNEMKTEDIVNKETKEVLTTKDGVTLVKNLLEVGDKFVSLWNKPVSETKGNAKHPRFYTKAKIKVKGTEVEVYLDLTPTQYDTLINVVNDKESDDLNQYVFTAYEYTNSLDTQSIGITHKVKKEAVVLD